MSIYTKKVTLSLIVACLSAHALQGASTVVAQPPAALEAAKMPMLTSATLAYLQNPHLNEQVKKALAKDIAKHKPLVAQVVQREKDHVATHTPVYHSDPQELRVIQDFLGYLYSHLTKCPVRKDFIFLRWWQQASACADVNSFCDMHKLVHGAGNFNDSNPTIASQLLSVNFALFGNTIKYGESSFKYFLNNSSCWQTGSSIAVRVLKDIFDHHGLNKKYIAELEALGRSIATPEGSLLQLLIPKTGYNNHVDKYLYLVGPDILYGVPRGSLYRDMHKAAIAEHDFCTIKNRYLRASGVLNHRLEKVLTLKNATLDGMQGRLLLNGDVLDPYKNDIKIYRYTSVPHEAQQKYNAELEALCKKIFADAQSTPARAKL